MQLSSSIQVGMQVYGQVIQSDKEGDSTFSSAAGVYRQTAKNKQKWKKKKTQLYRQVQSPSLILCNPLYSGQYPQIGLNRVFDVLGN